MNNEQFREAAHAAIDDVISYFDSLPDVRVTPSIKPGYLRPQLPSSAPQTPESWASIMSDVASKIVPGLTHWQSPNFMAFFPATVTYPSILGEIYSAAFNAPAFNWLCSPACTELETVVLDWVAEALGLPECFLSTGSTSGGGVIQGSASEALLTSMIAARDRWVRKRLDEEGLGEKPGESKEREMKREDRAAELRSKLVALGSDESHSSTKKAANILGVRYRTVRAGRDSGYAMTAAALETKLQEVREQGLEPIHLTVMLGTTNTCAVDDFEGISTLMKDWPDVWTHVDAAYAGGALLCEELRDEAKAKWLGEFDSFNLNLHKWLMVNFDANCLYVRNRYPLTTAMSITPSYLQNPASIAGLVTDYRDWQIPLGRRFRSLKIWFVLRTYGVQGLQKLVRRHVALGELFCTLASGRQDLFEVVTGPRFALTTIRCVLPGQAAGNLRNGMVEARTNGATGAVDDEMNDFGAKQGRAVTEESNMLTKHVLELINSRGEIFLTGSMADGVYIIRVVSANERAEEKYVERAFEILVATTEEVRAATT